MSLTSYQTAPPRDLIGKNKMHRFCNLATRFVNFLRAPATPYVRATKRRNDFLGFANSQFELPLDSQILGSREHDEIADRHILRTSQHEDDGFCHVLGAKSRALSDLSIDFGWIGNSPEFIQNHPGSNGSDAHTASQQLATETVNERLDRVFGGTIDRFPMDGLMT